MSNELDDLSPLAKRLVDAERKRPDEGGAVQDRLLARVTASVAVGAAGVAAGAKIASTASSTAATTTTTSAAGAAGLTAKAVPWIVAAFVAGGGAGAAIHASIVTAPSPSVVASSAPPRTAAAPEPIAPPPASTTPVVTPNDLRDLPSSAPHPSTAAPRPSTTQSANASDTDLAAERALVDRARSALAAGRPAAAIDAVDAHAARFPKGRLTEEREALAVQALARAGHTAAAKSRAAAFRKAYPDSLFAPAVDLAVP